MSAAGRRLPGSQQLPGGARVDRGLPAAHGPDPRDDVVGLGVLQQVADGTGVEGGDDPLGVRERGQHQHVRTAVGDDLPGGGDPVDPGHLQVHEDDVGAGLADDLDGLLAVGRRPDHGDVVDPGEQLLEPAAHDGVVVDEHHADGHLPVSNLIVVPAPGADRTTRVPPLSRTRLSRPRKP